MNNTIKPLPSLKALQSQLIYNPTTGELKRKSTGNVIGSNSKRYINLRINGTLYQAHRLIWKLMTGVDPAGVINHKNEDKSDNKWTNLEDITQAANLRYSLRGKGTHWVKRLNKWMAAFQIDKQRIYLGVFQTRAEAQQAVDAYRQATA